MTTDTIMQASSSTAAWIHRHPHHFLLALIVLLGLVGIPFHSWVTLTVAGLAMGLMVFVMASGMTLSFGLMGVLNLGHGALITVGAFVGATLVTGFTSGIWPLLMLKTFGWQPSPGTLWWLGAACIAALAGGVVPGLLRRFVRRGGWIAAGVGCAIAIAATILVLFPWRWTHAFVAAMGIVLPAFALGFLVLLGVGYLFERLIVRPVYRDPLKQILVTVGAAIVIAELLQALWGPDQLNMPRPEALQGGFAFGGVAIEKYRIFALVVGLAIYWAVRRVIHGTRVGLLIRAGVENPEMVEAYGYRIRLLFIAVFAAGAALAGVGGVMWGLFQGSVTVALGGEMLVTIIIVIIIGGLGSIAGCFYAALMVELLSNYMTYIRPDVALFSTIGLMVLVLLWRPQGLHPVQKVRT